MHKIAFKDLLEIQKNKEKGKYIKYDSLQMADYLLPEAQLNVSEKLDLFALRTEMNMNPNNFGRKIPILPHQHCSVFSNIPKPCKFFLGSTEITKTFFRP